MTKVWMLESEGRAAWVSVSNVCGVDGVAMVCTVEGRMYVDSGSCDPCSNNERVVRLSVVSNAGV